jgi:hypothetical protein
MDEFHDSGKPLVWAEAINLAIANRNFEDALAISKNRSNIQLGSLPLLNKIADESYIESLRSVNLSQEGGASNADDGGSATRAARNAIRVFSSNALAWLDLARAHAIDGDLDRAKKAVYGALRFDKDSRWIVRAAARFFVHCGNIEVGLHVIEQARGYKHDPWLVSAHIAVAHAMSKSSPLIKQARGILNSDEFRPKAVSELGMALATLEVSESMGGSRVVNKLARRALRDPTENAVAQAEWIESIFGKSLGAAEAAKGVEDAHEARARELQRVQDWAGALDEMYLWLCDQPFSSRPAIDGSYIAATHLRDFKRARQFAEVGFRANPKDSLVRNNYAVSLAESGDLVRARRVFDNLGDPSNKEFEETFRATEGLLRYREGRIESARTCYEECRASLEKLGDSHRALLSIVYQVPEEIQLGNVREAATLIKKGESYGRRLDMPDLTNRLKDLRISLEQLAQE